MHNKFMENLPIQEFAWKILWPIELEFKSSWNAVLDRVIMTNTTIRCINDMWIESAEY